MTDALRTALETADRLDAPTRARLTDLVESFVATHGDPAPFTEAERAHLRAVADEPFDPADPAEVAALFARRG